MRKVASFGNLTLYAYKHVEPGVIRHLSAFLRKVVRIVDVRHKLPVRIVPAPCVTTGDGGCGFAMFAVRTDDTRPQIWLGGDIRPIQQETGLSRSALLAFLREDLAHELAHYEQWRDGRTLQERGVAVRARSILAKA